MMKVFLVISALAAALIAGIVYLGYNHAPNGNIAFDCSPNQVAYWRFGTPGTWRSGLAVDQKTGEPLSCDQARAIFQDKTDSR